MSASIDEVKKRLKPEFGESLDINFLDEQGDGRHFFLEIISPVFTGKNRIQRSKIIYRLLDDLIQQDSIHALRMNLKTPDEI